MADLFIKKEIVPVNANNCNVQQGLVTVSNISSTSSSSVNYTAGNGICLDGTSINLSGNYCGTFFVCGNQSGTTANFCVNNYDIRMQSYNNCLYVEPTYTGHKCNFINGGYLTNGGNFYFDSLGKCISYNNAGCYRSVLQLDASLDLKVGASNICNVIFQDKNYCKTLSELAAGGAGGGITGAGTTNYIPKFTGSTGIGNSSIVDNGTYVNLTNLAIGSCINSVSGTYNLTVYGNNAGIYLKRCSNNEPFILLYNDTAASGGQVRGLDGGGLKFTDCASTVVYACLNCNGLTIPNGKDLILNAAESSADSGDIVFKCNAGAAEWARIWTSNTNGCLCYRNACDGLTSRKIFTDSNISEAKINANIINTSCTSYTLSAADNNAIIEFTSASNVVVYMPACSVTTKGFQATLVKTSATCNICLCVCAGVTLCSLGGYRKICCANNTATVYQSGACCYRAFGGLET